MSTPQYLTDLPNAVNPPKLAINDFSTNKHTFHNLFKKSSIIFSNETNIFGAENRSNSGNSKKKSNPKNPPAQTANSEDGVVFPSSSAGINVRNSFPNKTLSIPTQNEIAKCKTNAIGGTLCNISDNYPANLVKNVINSRNLSAEFFGTDTLPSDFINFKTTDDEWKTFCESREQVVFPKIGETVNNEWKFIFQDPTDKRFRQGVRTEICMNENAACNIIDVVPNGYEVHCSQKYIYRTMVSIGTNAEVQPDVFKLPSCCVCVYKPQAESRMGSISTRKPGTQSSASRKG